jgi:hypothetical protein
MDKVVICHACGRTMESAFKYCPWCGDRIDRGDQVGRGERTEFSALTELVESVFSQVESMQTTHACSRISRMENELGELEKELSLLIAGEHTS